MSAEDLAREAALRLATIGREEGAEHDISIDRREQFGGSAHVGDRRRRVHRGERRRPRCPVAKAATEKGLGFATIRRQVYFRQKCNRGLRANRLDVLLTLSGSRNWTRHCSYVSGC